MPDKQNVAPRYDQKLFSTDERKGQLQTLVTSIDDNKESDSLKIHQDAKLSRVDLESDTTFTYKLKSVNHGVYTMVIDGEIEIDSTILKSRDAIGIWETDSFKINAKKETQLLFIEVPLQF